MDRASSRRVGVTLERARARSGSSRVRLRSGLLVLADCTRPTFHRPNCELPLARYVSKGVPGDSTMRASRPVRSRRSATPSLPGAIPRVQSAAISVIQSDLDECYRASIPPRYLTAQRVSITLGRRAPGEGIPKGRGPRDSSPGKRTRVRRLREDRVR